MVQKAYFIEIMGNLSKLQEQDRFSNWYYGYTEIEYHQYYKDQLYFTVDTSATSGNISTQYF